MTLTVEKYRKQLIELQLDIEKVQAYILLHSVRPEATLPTLAAASQPLAPVAPGSSK